MRDASDSPGIVERLIVAVASPFVPMDRRAEWRREWLAELGAAEDRNGRSRLALGALPDALALRKLARADRRARGRDRRRKGGGMIPGDVVRELKRAGRSLVRAPGFTLASVVTLGLGLGATAAIFTLVNAIVLRPLPYPSADRLVTMHHTMTDEGAAGIDWPFTLHAFLHFREQTRAFETLGAYRSLGEYTLRGDGQAELVRGVQATAGLLELLDARTVLGRTLTAEEDLVGGPPVVVLGHGLWQRRFGGDPGVLGRTIRLGDTSRQVVGVMSPDVQLPTASVDVWLPADLDPMSPPSDNFRFYVIGRLAAGQNLDAAQSDANRITGTLGEVAPVFSIFLNEIGLRTHVRPLREVVIGDVERALWILLAAVGIVLLVALANVANLFLVRAEGLREEVAVRSALGARRGHLLGHFLAESSLVALASGVLALLLAAGGIRILVAMAPPSIPRLDALHLDATTAGVVILLCVFVAGVLGAYPHIRFGSSTIGGLSQRGVSGARDRRQAWTGDVLVASQVALALMLVAGAALLLRSFQSLRSVDVGFDAAGVLVTEVTLPAETYTSHESVIAFLDQLDEQMRAVPGIRDVAVGQSPLSGGSGCSGVHREGEVLAEGTFPPCAPRTVVGTGYFELLGIPLRAGRTLTAVDVRDPAPVAVVTEGLAARLWPGEDPIGRGIRPAPSNGPPWYRVVGVVGDVRSSGPDSPPEEMIYFPPAFAHDPFFGLLLRAPLLLSIDPGTDAAVVSALRRVVTGLDANVPLTVVGRLDDALGRSMVRTSFTLFLLGTAAVTALVLAVVGLYGVVAYRVRKRRSEFGIRMALGASGSDVRGMVLRHALRLVLAGVAAGLLGAAVGTRSLGSLLHGVRAGDPWMLAGAAATVVLTALLASWIPANRATRVEPSASLRVE